MKKEILDKGVFLVHDFFTEDECRQYIEFGISEGFEEAKINKRGEQVMNKSVRNNERLLFFDQDLADKLWGRLSEFVPDTNGTYRKTGLNEMFRIYAYDIGQQFKVHQDGSYIRNEDERSLYSFLIYLNDDFEGGETNFVEQFSVKPKQGMALIFKHWYVHEGKPVISGHKYVLRTDIMFNKSKQ